MVRVQPMSGGEGERVLVGSDQADPAAARRELEAWAAENGYRLARGARPLAFFEDGVLVREWVPAERAPRVGRAAVVASRFAPRRGWERLRRLFVALPTVSDLDPPTTSGATDHAA